MDDKERKRQLNYSSIQPKMLDTTDRSPKANKISRIIRHFLGSDDLRGLTVVDVGCSGGAISRELAADGAWVLGVDIDDDALGVALQVQSDRTFYVRADSERLPLPTGIADVVICNHVYEHVVDATNLFSEVRRILRPAGVAYLGLGNRWGVIEPHHRLPFLSWLPRSLADWYLRLTGRGAAYHERFATRRTLLRYLQGFRVWDYTWVVVQRPHAFGLSGFAVRTASRLPSRVLRLFQPVVPTFLWVAAISDLEPQGNSKIVPTLVRSKSD